MDLPDALTHSNLPGGATGPRRRPPRRRAASPPGAHREAGLLGSADRVRGGRGDGGPPARTTDTGTPVVQSHRRWCSPA
ncbi:hypothetical protein O1L55_25830 [Streptomyces albulus]|nr:hypothetical protein [Streptomyces noursei]